MKCSEAFLEAAKILDQECEDTFGCCDAINACIPFGKEFDALFEDCFEYFEIFRPFHIQYGYWWSSPENPVGYERDRNARVLALLFAREIAKLDEK